MENHLIAPDDARHASRVLRLKAGEQVVCVEDGRRFSARILELSDKGGRVELLGELPSNEPPVDITVYQGIPKAEKLEFLAQKLTELGVKRLVPVRMERSVSRFDGGRRGERLERISREAVKQCRRALPMEIASPMSWAQAVKDMAQRELMIVPWENEGSVRLRDIRAEYPAARDIGILIGPEGGITSGEIASLDAHTVLLGPRILRAETAAAVSAALVMALWGDI